MSALDTLIQSPPMQAAPGWSVLPAWMPVPGLGALPVNAFVLSGAEPMLVDTGLAALGDAFVEALALVVEPAELRWIWLSHTDPDHIGNFARILELAPRAQVLTGFLGMGKMGLAGLDTSRVRLLEPGASLQVGRHRLHPLRPPYYDAPETLGFYDETSHLLFAADSFGALLPGAVDELDDVPEDSLREGMTAWSAIDAPWLSGLDGAVRDRTFGAVARLAPDVILAGHLPVARKAAPRLARWMTECGGRGDADVLSTAHVLSAMVEPTAA